MTRRNLPIFDQLAEQFEPRMRAAFLDAIQEVNDDATLARLAVLIEQGDFDGVFRELGIDPVRFQQMSLVMEDTFRAGGFAFADEVTASGARVLFDVRNMQAEQWIAANSSRLITNIIEGQRASIRSALQYSLSQGDNPRSTARQLVGYVDPRTRKRSGGIVGLTPQQERWQQAYASELRSGDPALLRNALNRELRDKRFDNAVKKAVSGEEPLTADRINRMLSSYRNKSLKFRGNNIARTETLQSLAAARYEAARQAVDRGDLPREAVKVVWDATGDARTRMSHMQLDGQENTFGVPFKTITGSELRYPGDAALGADASELVNCRCRLNVRVDFRKVQRV